MSALDLTPVIEAVARARWERTSLAAKRSWDDIGENFRSQVRNTVSSADIAAAAPLIARQVADSIAAEIVALPTPSGSEHYRYGYGNATGDAAAIAREWSPA